jgi:hypothetical protein
VIANRGLLDRADQAQERSFAADRSRPCSLGQRVLVRAHAAPSVGAG